MTPLPGFFSWVAAHPNGGYGVRCDTCDGGWWSDAHGDPITVGERLNAEALHGRHDRNEHPEGSLTRSVLMDSSPGGGR